VGEKYNDWGQNPAVFYAAGGFWLVDIYRGFIRAFMTQITPLQGSILQTPQAQRQQVDSKTHQLRRAQEMLRNSAGAMNAEDTVDIEVPVESSEDVKPIQDHGQDARQQKNQRHAQQNSDESEHEDDEDHLDLTA
jgi:hypothetical protein